MSPKRPSFSAMYANRPLVDGYPELEALGVSHYTEHQHDDSKIKLVFECLSRLIDLERSPRTVAVVGCGPNPRSVKALLELGYDAVGVEPVVGSAEAARKFLANRGRVYVGTAEHLPLPEASQRVIVMESVLEHVDSTTASVAEAYRALTPGGVLYLTTNNRYALKSNEFRPRLYHWFPAIVKECYVFRHLHYDPSLADYTPRPAVHWFSFAEMCSLGRQVGFAQFYSLLDLVKPDAPYISKSVLRRLSLEMIQQNPWARALALVLFGHAIIMYKRPEAGAAQLRPAVSG